MVQRSGLHRREPSQPNRSRVAADDRGGVNSLSTPLRSAAPALRSSARRSASGTLWGPHRLLLHCARAKLSVRRSASFCGPVPTRIHLCDAGATGGSRYPFRSHMSR